MKLVFFSGPPRPRGDELTHEFAALIPKGGRLAYVPSSSLGTSYYPHFVAAMRSHGVRKMDHIAVDCAEGKTNASKLSSFDAVYLSGGNTFYFLTHLRRTGALSILRSAAHQGCVVAGQSAGAIIMTANINTGGLPDSGDSNDVGLKNRNALKLVDFEFAPHFIAREHTRELSAYAKNGTTSPIFACDDNAGIVVDQSRLIFTGKVRCFIGATAFDLAEGLKN